MLPLKFVEKIYNYEITLDEGMDDQTKLEKLIIRLQNYKARSEKKKKKIEEKNKVLESAAELFCVREDIIGFFGKGIFPFKGNLFKRKEEKPEQELKRYINNTFTFIKEKSRGTHNDLFKTYFNFSEPIDLEKKYSKQKIK